jgi:hypothetical protein
MKRRNQKLALNHETLRMLSGRELGGVASGVPNYDMSIDHKGCSSITIKATCYSDCPSCVITTCYAK